VLPNPLHPAIVHFPIVLATLIPIFAIVALIVKARRPAASRVWLVVIVLQFLLVASTRVATQTGENEEEVVEKVVAESEIHEHEEAAEKVMAFGLVGLVLSLLGLARGRAGQVAQLVAVTAFLAAGVAAFQTAKLGGELVYKHGAASAYASPSGVSAEPGMQEFQGTDEDDDDHDDDGDDD